MQYARGLRAVWSWLPAFRAVAETGHLPTAGRELGVVPSSLSRAVRLLEDQLGASLFERHGRALVLNDAGRTVLGAVRDAMRILDDALTAAADDALRGSVHAVAVPELVEVVLAPACAGLIAAHPQLTVGLAAARDDEIGALLLRGDADAAVMTRPPVHDDLTIERLAIGPRAAYVAPSHPLARGRVRGPRLAQTRAIAVGAYRSVVDDGWPVEIPRRIVAWASDERAALAACALGDAVAVAFDAIAAPAVAAGRLVRLRTPAIAARALYLVHRRPVAAHHRRTEALVDAIRHHASAAAYRS